MGITWERAEALAMLSRDFGLGNAWAVTRYMAQICERMAHGMSTARALSAVAVKERKAPAQVRTALENGIDAAMLGDLADRVPAGTEPWVYLARRVTLQIMTRREAMMWS